MKVLQTAEHKILLVNERYTELKKQILTRWEAIQQVIYNIMISAMLVKLMYRKFYEEYYKVWFSNQYFFDICKWSSVHFLSPINILGKKSLLSLYFSYINSYIISANLVRGSTRTANLKGRSSQQKHGLRIIDNEDKYYHTKELFKGTTYLIYVP